jgi:starvation-inducible DNA-binding protein
MQVVARDITDRDSITGGLAKVLADTRALCAKTYRFQRDVGGPTFMVLRPLLKQQRDELELATDRIAERMRFLDLAAHLRRRILRKPLLHRGPEWTTKAMVSCLIARHETVARRAERVFGLAEKATDRATCDLLRERIKAHERAIWVLVAAGIAALIGDRLDPRTPRVPSLRSTILGS